MTPNTHRQQLLGLYLGYRPWRSSSSLMAKGMIHINYRVLEDHFLHWEAVREKRSLEDIKEGEGRGEGVKEEEGPKEVGAGKKGKNPKGELLLGKGMLGGVGAILKGGILTKPGSRGATLAVASSLRWRTTSSLTFLSSHLQKT